MNDIRPGDTTETALEGLITALLPRLGLRGASVDVLTPEGFKGTITATLSVSGVRGWTA